jgi:hypothetical protein
MSFDGTIAPTRLAPTCATAVTYATKALASAGQNRRAAGLVIVTADESKGGGAQLYLWDGSAFRWVATVQDS